MDNNFGRRILVLVGSIVTIAFGNDFLEIIGLFIFIYTSFRLVNLKASEEK